MDRRTLLFGLGAMVGGIALDQAIPLGRVFSFPKDIKPANLALPTTMTEIIARHSPPLTYEMFMESVRQIREDCALPPRPLTVLLHPLDVQRFKLAFTELVL